jgi:hypothetical protein
MRRGAGTKTFSDLLLNPNRLLDAFTGGGVARADADAVAFAAGEARAVSAFARQGSRFVQGLLLLDPAAATPIVWRKARIPGRSSQDIVLSAPIHVYGVGPVGGPGSTKVSAAQFRLISLQAADRFWELAVPTLDVPLVRTALARTGSVD